MKEIVLFIFTVLIVSNISAEEQPPSCDCDYTINDWNWEFDGERIGNMPNVTIHDPIVAAAHPVSNMRHNDSLSLAGGDVICLDASVSFRFLTWKNIIGDSINPIIIKNVFSEVN